MKTPTLTDYTLLVILALIWASAFFNIKISTYSFGPVTIAFLRVLLGSIPVLLLCYYKKIKIEAFSKDWFWFASIGTINLVIPFFLIAYGVQKVQSNLAAILMASTPLSATILAHFFTENEKINFIKVLGVLIGFSGIVFLFSDDILINENNIFSALLILGGSTFYVIGGLLTLKISNKENENVTSSIDSNGRALNTNSSNRTVAGYCKKLFPYHEYDIIKEYLCKQGKSVMYIEKMNGKMPPSKAEFETKNTIDIAILPANKFTILLLNLWISGVSTDSSCATSICCIAFIRCCVGTIAVDSNIGLSLTSTFAV